MVKKIKKYLKFVVCCALIMSLVAPSYAALGASDGSAFVTKAEFDAALADFNSRLTTFEAGINSKIDSQVTSYLDRNGIWNGKAQVCNWTTKRIFYPSFFGYDIPDGTTVLTPTWRNMSEGVSMMQSGTWQTAYGLRQTATDWPIYFNTSNTIPTDLPKTLPTNSYFDFELCPSINKGGLLILEIENKTFTRNQAFYNAYWKTGTSWNDTSLTINIFCNVLQDNVILTTIPINTVSYWTGNILFWDSATNKNQNANGLSPWTQIPLGVLGFRSTYLMFVQKNKPLVLRCLNNISADNRVSWVGLIGANNIGGTEWGGMDFEIHSAMVY